MAHLTKKQEAYIQSLPPDQRRAERAILNETILMDIRKAPKSKLPPIPRYKPKKKRKGDSVQKYNLGGLLPPTGPMGTPQGAGNTAGVGAGVGKGVVQPKKQNPLAAKDAELKKIALKKKEMDIAGATLKKKEIDLAAAKPKAPAPKPGMAPPGMPQQVRKGGTIKNYSNMCKTGLTKDV